MFKKATTKQKETEEAENHRDKEKIITFQTSSLGKIVPRFLKTFYQAFTDKPLSSSYDICDNFRVIFPTEEYVQNSHLGVEMASSVILQEKFWEEVHDYPKKSFHQLKGTSNQLDRNLFHAKILIVNDKDSDRITDNSLLYFGSHNFSPSAWGNIEK